MADPGTILGIITAAGSLASALWKKAEEMRAYTNEVRIVSTDLSQFALALDFVLNTIESLPELTRSAVILGITSHWAQFQDEWQILISKGDKLRTRLDKLEGRSSFKKHVHLMVKKSDFQSLKQRTSCAMAQLTQLVAIINLEVSSAHAGSLNTGILQELVCQVREALELTKQTQSYPVKERRQSVPPNRKSSRKSPAFASQFKLKKSKKMKAFRRETLARLPHEEMSDISTRRMNIHEASQEDCDLSSSTLGTAPLTTTESDSSRSCAESDENSEFYSSGNIHDVSQEDCNPSSSALSIAPPATTESDSSRSCAEADENFEFYSSGNIHSPQSHDDSILSIIVNPPPMWKMRATEDFEDEVCQGDIFHACIHNLAFILPKGEFVLTIPYSKFELVDHEISSSSDSCIERSDFHENDFNSEPASPHSPFHLPDDFKDRKECTQKQNNAARKFTSESMPPDIYDGQFCQVFLEESVCSGESDETVVPCICWNIREYERSFYPTRRVKNNGEIRMIFKRVRFLVDPCGHCWELPGCGAIEYGTEKVHGHEVSLRDDDIQQGWVLSILGRERSRTSTQYFISRCCQSGFHPVHDGVDEVEYSR